MKKFDQINVVPFIDIMLVLLAIVLTTATFITQEYIKLDLPSAKQSQHNAKEKLVTITIDKNLVLYLNNTHISEKALDTNLQDYPAKQAIVLKIDATVPFDQFIAVLDTLKKYRFENLSIMTKQPS